MVRVLLEISLPQGALEGVRRALAPSALPEGLTGRLEPLGGLGGCESLARGGANDWTPCWVCLEAGPGGEQALAGVLARLREALTEAARAGGLELLAIPATAQLGEEFCRFRDLLDVARRLG
ncbi:MAG: hypothetical protein SCH98_13720 [Deferrisomatales bacterium]|nr:hypothetical protein [Deferrisomatales bacterium]